MPKTVFITGAAAGIGRQTALVFAAKGYTVGAYDIDEAGLASLADRIRSAGGTVLTGHLDVVNNDEMTARVSEFAQANGNRLDVMINNAGVLTSGRLAEGDPDTMHTVIDVNCKGVVNGCHAAFEYLRSTPSSVLVNVTSASAIYGQPELAVYSATKFFVRAITEALDIEWERDGIRVVDVWPLFVGTAMTDGLQTGSTESLGIHLTAREVAEAVVTAVDASGLRKRLRQVHFPVGTMTRAAIFTRLLPGWANRHLQKRLSRA